MLRKGGPRIQVFVDACERDGKSELPWPGVRGARYSKWLTEHLLGNGVPMAAGSGSSDP